MEKRQVKLQKIPLEGFIDVLMEMYMRGANYVDILAIPDSIQDVIGIEIKREYLEKDNDFVIEDLQLSQEILDKLI